MLKNLRRQLEPTLERSTVDTSPSELAPAAAECTVHYHYVLLSRRPVFLHHLIGITHDTKASTRTRRIRSSPSYVQWKFSCGTSAAPQSGGSRHSCHSPHQPRCHSWSSAVTINRICRTRYYYYWPNGQWCVSGIENFSFFFLGLLGVWWIIWLENCMPYGGAIILHYYFPLFSLYALYGTSEPNAAIFLISSHSFESSFVHNDQSLYK